ncbi:accessory Sec system glycosylation chaperone GtfB [Macrococcus capreoli]|uniref:accessory Sec system glycosylation chaperone GtfB n=1 Tax=Macrococcus capreoli TaxID=2982690 RepID=UPI003EE50551
MILLLDDINENNERLIETLNILNDIQIISMNDNGFLLQEIITPYKYFTKYDQYDGKPLFFNQLEIPDLWTIEGHVTHSYVKDNEQIRGKIYYQSDFKTRIISHVDWFDNSMKVIHTDYYAINGIKYASAIYQNEKISLIHYYNPENKIIITENNENGFVFLNHDNCQKFFYTRESFHKYFLTQVNSNNEKFIITNLNNQLNLIKQFNAKHIFICQPNFNLDNHIYLDYIIKNDYQFMVIDDGAYEKLINLYQNNRNIQKFGYVYHFRRENHYKRKILILTNSDELNNIERFVESFPGIEFNIAAQTNMSEKLLKLNEYKNVYLYSGATLKKMTHLMYSCDIYLDINKYDEINDAVRSAFYCNLLIIAYKPWAHNKLYTAPEHMYSDDNFERCENLLNELYKSKDNFNQHIKLQQSFAHGISKNELKELITNT